MTSFIDIDTSFTFVNYVTLKTLTHASLFIDHCVEGRVESK